MQLAVASNSCPQHSIAIGGFLVRLQPLHLDYGCVVKGGSIISKSTLFIPEACRHAGSRTINATHGISSPQDSWAETLPSGGMMLNRSPQLPTVWMEVRLPMWWTLPCEIENCYSQLRVSYNSECDNKQWPILLNESLSLSLSVQTYRPIDPQTHWPSDLSAHRPTDLQTHRACNFYFVV